MFVMVMADGSDNTDDLETERPMVTNRFVFYLDRFVDCVVITNRFV